MVDVFSDASQRGKVFAGAYIVGLGSVPVMIRHSSDCENSVQAELLTMAVAVQVALKSHEPRTLRVHSDLENIDCVIERHHRRQVHPGKQLSEYRQLGVKFTDDANRHATHSVCHRYARIAAGIKGSRHPALKAASKSKVERAPAVRRQYRKMVVQALRIHSAGVSGVRLAQEVGLNLTDVEKTLKWLHHIGAAECHRPSCGIAQCDLSQYKWRPIETAIEVEFEALCIDSA